MGDPSFQQIAYNDFIKVTNRFDDNGIVVVG
jgi:hypothetical protein